MVGRTRAALVGILVVGAAVALAEALVRVASSGPGPVEAVAEAFIDLTPGGLKELAVSLFGTADKVALGVGIAVVMVALAGWSGVRERRRRWSGGLVVALIGVLAALATATRPDGGPAAAWPVLAATACGVTVLTALLGPASPDRALDRVARDPGRAMAERRELDRRHLFAGAGALVAVAFVGAGLGRTGRARAGAARAGPAAARVTLPEPAHPLPAPPAAAEVGVAGVVPFQTPAANFYRIDTAFFVPQVAAATWRLRVHGLVEREVTLTWDELLAAPLVEAWVTLCCVSNEVGGDLVGNARWLGLPVRELLVRAGPRPGADMVLSRSDDGFSASTPLEVLTDGRHALLAVGMDGHPLPTEHGFPARLVVPGLYGYVSATKWVTELEVTRFADRTAYWTDRGWAPRGPVKLSSRIDVPRPGARLDVGVVRVAGVAWAQHTGVAAVEVRVDGGAWEAAELAADVHVDAWRQWVHRWRAEPGEHHLEVRATDRDGLVQTGEWVGVVPDGATGWHRVDVEVR